MPSATNPDPCCAVCVYFRPFGDLTEEQRAAIEDEDKAPHGVCRRFPPQCSFTADGGRTGSAHPLVSRATWCGEFDEALAGVAH